MLPIPAPPKAPQTAAPSQARGPRNDYLRTHTPGRPRAPPDRRTLLILAAAPDESRIVLSHVVVSCSIPLRSPKPANVRENGSDGVEPLEPPRRSRHPQLIYQRQRDASFAKGVRQFQHHPVFVTNLDGMTVAVRQFVQEGSQPLEECINRSERSAIEIAELQ